MKGSLDELFGRPMTDIPTQGRGEAKEEKSDDSLTLADMQGVMRPANKEIGRLHVIDSKGVVRTFNYDHLDVEHRFDGERFSVVFAGTKHYRIDVTGRNLWRVYDYITIRRWPYLRQAPRDFASDGEMIITLIEIHDITPKYGE